MFWAVFICSFSILRNSQLESDICCLPYTWSLNSTVQLKSSKTVNLLPWNCTGKNTVDQCSETTHILCRSLFGAWMITWGSALLSHSIFSPTDLFSSAIALKISSVLSSILSDEGLLFLVADNGLLFFSGT